MSEFLGAKGRKLRRLVAPILALMVIAAYGLQSHANVTLIRFEATAQPDNTIKIEWETATEISTLGFKLYRSESNTGPWGDPISSQGAKGGGVGGAVYTHIDGNVVPQVRYYYRLEELASDSSGGFHGPISAGIGLSPDPTGTATATATATATTSGAKSTSTPTLTVTVTPIPPGPTATQRYTNTPPPDTPVPATAPPASTPVPNVPATITPVAQAVVATPTGLPPPAVTAFVPAATSAPPPAQPPATAAPPPAATATETRPAAVAQAATLAPTVSPVARTPQVFAPATSQAVLDGSQGARPTPTPAADAARNTRRILVLGGGAIGAAVLLAAAALVAWRVRRR